MCTADAQLWLLATQRQHVVLPNYKPANSRLVCWGVVSCPVDPLPVLLPLLALVCPRAPSGCVTCCAACALYTAVRPTDYVWLGCVADTSTYTWLGGMEEPGTALDRELLYLKGGMDTTQCAAAAKQAGYKLFGTQWGSYCVGGKSLTKALQFTSKKAVCNAPCAATDLPGRTCGSKPPSATAERFSRASDYSYWSTDLYVLKNGKGGG